MKRFTGLKAVFRREFQGYFSSPLGYIFIVIFLVASGYLTVSRDFGRFLEVDYAVGVAVGQALHAVDHEQVVREAGHVTRR